MTTAYEWSGDTGDVWAEEWRRTDRSFADLARHLDAAILAAAPAGPFRALDIGCGAGATSIALARARPDAEIIGIDLSANLVAVARQRAAAYANCRFKQGDVSALAGAIAPDLLFSRHGVMFFADPAAAFAQLHAAAAPGAALIFSCFAAREANRFATIADEATGTPSPAPSTAPGPFAFADPAHVGAVLARAGWRCEAPTEIAFAYRAGAGPDPVADAISFLSRIGPAAAVLADVPADRGERIRMALADLLARYRAGNVVEMSATAWLWRARKEGSQGENA